MQIKPCRPSAFDNIEKLFRRRPEKYPHLVFFSLFLPPLTQSWRLHQGFRQLHRSKADWLSLFLSLSLSHEKTPLSHHQFSTFVNTKIKIPPTRKIKLPSFLYKNQYTKKLSSLPLLFLFSSSLASVSLSLSKTPVTSISPHFSLSVCLSLNFTFPSAPLISFSPPSRRLSTRCRSHDPAFGGATQPGCD